MLNCRITSTQRTEDYSDLDSVILPGLTGEIQILSNHAEIFLLIDKGDIVLTQNGTKIKTIPVIHGECHVLDNSVSVVL